MQHGVIILMKNIVVVIIRNVVVDTSVSTTTYCAVVKMLTTGMYLVANSINDGAFNDHERPHFCGR